MESTKYNVEINLNVLIIVTKNKGRNFQVKRQRLWFRLKYKGIELNVIFGRYHDIY